MTGRGSSVAPSAANATIPSTTSALINPEILVIATSNSPQVLGADWQAADAFAGQRENRVGQRRGHGSNAGFTRPTHLFNAGDNMNFDLGHFVDAQHPIIVEVAL